MLQYDTKRHAGKRLALCGSLWKRCLTRINCEFKPARFPSTGISVCPLLRGEKVTLREVRDERRAGAAGHADERRGGGVRIASAAHGGRVSGVHRRSASRAHARQQLLLRRSCPTGTTTRWGCSRCASSSPDSAAPSGALPSARRSGAGGVFVEGAKAVIDFSFGVVGMHRLEARSIASNGRGNAALRKVGRAAGRHAPPFVSAERTVLRSDSLVDSQGRLAADEGGMGPAIALTTSGASTFRAHPQRARDGFPHNTRR